MGEIRHERLVEEGGLCLRRCLKFHQSLLQLISICMHPEPIISIVPFLLKELMIIFIAVHWWALIIFIVLCIDCLLCYLWLIDSGSPQCCSFLTIEKAVVFICLLLKELLSRGTTFKFITGTFCRFNVGSDLCFCFLLNCDDLRDLWLRGWLNRYHLWFY